MNYLLYGLLGAGLVMAGCGGDQVTAPVPAGPGMVEMSPASGAQIAVPSGSGMQSQVGQPLRQQTGQMMTPSTSYATPVQFTSNGQRIYFTAASASRTPITFTMGAQISPNALPGYRVMGGGMVGAGMMGGRRGGRSSIGMGMQGGGHYGMACATCHGPEGKGGIYLAMGTVVTPDIRYAVLSAPELDPETQAVERPAFSEEGIKQAITQGLEPNGERLNPFMPRWSMSAQDMADLLAFLKIL